jgi:hypothetical protein
MRLRLELLQWFGLLGAALTWTGQLVLGYGVTVGHCNPANLGGSLDTWQIVLMAAGGPIVLAAEAAAIAVFLETRDAGHDGAPPDGRRHFFASAAVVGNVLFLIIILLSGVGALANSGCGQA